MAKDEHESPNNTNDSESNGNSNSNSNSQNEAETLEIDSTRPTNYEKQRQARIAANNARMKALGLRNIANSLIGTPQNPRNSRNSASKSKNDVKKKGKGGEDDDDEYEPDCDRNDGDSESNGSSDDDDDDDDDDFEEEEETFVRRNKFTPKKKGKKSSANKQVPMSSNPTDISVYMDEDEALKQALALSLKDLGEIPELQHGKAPQSSKKRTTSSKEKSRDHSQEDNTNRRKRKLFTSRVQMTDDDLVIHFCQIDEVGKGGITVRDVERMAATHDFNWTDKELSDMIRCFDSDRDGKLTLDDFRNIVQRCNMLQTQL